MKSKDMASCKCPPSIENRHLEVCPHFKPPHDPVENPSHYTSPEGVQCIKIARRMSYCRGSAFKYIWRAGKKEPAKEIQDLRKAIQFLKEEIDLLSENNPA